MLFEHDIPYDFIYLSVNKEFEMLTGLKNVVGKRVSEIIPGVHELSPELLKTYGRVALSGHPEKFEMYLDTLGIWFSVSVYCPCKEQFVALFDNITDRKHAEKALLENETRLNEMFENLSSGVVTYRASPGGQDFIFASFNKAAERIESMHREDLIGKSVVEVFPSIKEFGLLEVFRRVWQSGVAEHFPVSFYQDGHISGWRENYVYKLSNQEIVAIYDDVTKEKQAEEKMRYLAHYDALTGLPNRALFKDRLKQSLATAKRDNAYLALMFLDLDKFKPVNDELGHDIGDQLLKEAAKRMLNCVRESDTVSRIGGDEFVVLLSSIDTASDAMLVAEKIRESLNQPFQLAGRNLNISSSTGIAVYPEHGKDQTQLMKNADIAMYHAKEAGRNRVWLYRPNMRTKNSE
jgi:diguanylate cyclase (GGDEF)-like protein/PAS domain S-box-containing protein